MGQILTKGIGFFTPFFEYVKVPTRFFENLTLYQIYLSGIFLMKVYKNSTVLVHTTLCTQSKITVKVPSLSGVPLNRTTHITNVWLHRTTVWVHTTTMARVEINFRGPILFRGSPY